MYKRSIVLIFSAIFCLFLFCGCAEQAKDPDPANSGNSAVTPGSSGDSIDSPAVDPGNETDEKTPTGESGNPSNPLPYTVRLSGLTSIFDSPTYDGCYTRSVGSDGVYTIVEEKTDDEGNCWGKLKSGAGWIDLSALDSTQPVIAGLSDEHIREKPHHICLMDNSDGMQYLVFAATETLSDVRLTMLTPNDRGYEEHSTLHTIAQMTPEKPLVAEVVFYGESTTFGLAFTDESGQSRYFALYISGRNGAPVLQEFQP